MALKTLMFVCFLVAATMALVAPVAEAQLGGLITGLLGLIKIQGTVFCSVDGNMGVNGTATPVFPISSACTAQQLQLSSQNSPLQPQCHTAIRWGTGFVPTGSWKHPCGAPEHHQPRPYRVRADTTMISSRQRSTIIDGDNKISSL
ncbi:hypothetical protein PTKIN_Ptkin09bG0019000 [Pterospermum kingtungense]